VNGHSDLNAREGIDLALQIDQTDYLSRRAARRYAGCMGWAAEEVAATGQQVIAAFEKGDIDTFIAGWADNAVF
jgi:hypothetical protein